MDPKPIPCLCSRRSAPPINPERRTPASTFLIPICIKHLASFSPAWKTWPNIRQTPGMPAPLQYSAASEKAGLVLYYLGSGKPGLGRFSLAPRAICFGKESWVKRYAAQFDRLREVPPRALAQHRALKNTHLCCV